jgi:hypothetical protein
MLASCPARMVNHILPLAGNPHADSNRTDSALAHPDPKVTPALERAAAVKSASDRIFEELDTASASGSDPTPMIGTKSRSRLYGSVSWITPCTIPAVVMVRIVYPSRRRTRDEVRSDDGRTACPILCNNLSAEMDGCPLTKSTSNEVTASTGRIWDHHPNRLHRIRLLRMGHAHRAKDGQAAQNSSPLHQCFTPFLLFVPMASQSDIGPCSLFGSSCGTHG